jgi:fructosamine-3-kinase
MDIFTKHNTTGYHDALLKEANGLKELQKLLVSNEYLHIPTLLHADASSLQLEKIPSTSPIQKLSRQLGIGLAKLHQHRLKQYGFYENNYIGLNPQQNILSDNWGEFFVEYRLSYQIGLIQNRSIQNEFLAKLDREKLIPFLNATTAHPSLVHGDLWSGNVLYGNNQVYLIDPAVYYGDREVDIAMSEMFGGFGSAFYNAYNDTYPLSEHYPLKREIYNLYHYLNHYNLFGNGYLNGCKERIESISATIF